MKNHAKLQIHLTRLLVLCAALLTIPMGGCATYRAEAIEGWVVDAETNKPLEGVNVVANWDIENSINGRPIEQVQIFETVTDQNGRYSFPAWGPKVILTMGNKGGNSPRLLLFKSGYRAGGFPNFYWQTYGTSTFFYNKKTLKLERFKGALQDYERSLNSLNSSLWMVGHDGGAPCGWESFPQMLKAIDAQYAEFRRAGGNPSSVVGSLRANDANLKAANCGSINELLKP